MGKTSLSWELAEVTLPLPSHFLPHIILAKVPASHTLKKTKKHLVLKADNPSTKKKILK